MRDYITWFQYNWSVVVMFFGLILMLHSSLQFEIPADLYQELASETYLHDDINYLNYILENDKITYQEYIFFILFKESNEKQLSKNNLKASLK